MNDKILTLEPDSPLNTKEQMDRLSAAVRVWVRQRSLQSIVSGRIT